MEYPRIALRTGPKQFNKLIDLGSKIVVCLTGNSHYTTPTPTVLALQTAVTDCQIALTTWGGTGNRGSHADYVFLCQKALDLQLMLKEMADYVANTAGIAAGSDYVTMRTIMSTSGFDLAKIKEAHDRLSAVRDFRIFNPGSVNKNQAKMRWTRPLNTSSSEDVDIYEVRRSATPDFNAAQFVGNTSKSVFVDTNTSGATVTWYYWVVAYNSAGAGVVSEMVVATLAAAA